MCVWQSQVVIKYSSVYFNDITNFEAVHYSACVGGGAYMKICHGGGAHMKMCQYHRDGAHMCHGGGAHMSHDVSVSDEFTKHV